MGRAFCLEIDARLQLLVFIQAIFARIVYNL
jgi:hypothetical protein